MKLNARLLKIFSKCPAAFLFSLKDKSSLVTEQERIINNVILKCVSQMMETSFRVRWKVIVGWVDKEVFKNENIHDREKFDIAKRNSEHILLALRDWYKESYLNWSTESFINIYLRSFKSKTLIEDKASIISLTDPITCISINSNNHENKRIYHRDIELKVLAWLVSKELGCKEVMIESISLGSRGRMDINKIFYNKESLYKTETYIENICKIIEKKYYYPSITNECPKCDYYQKCNP